MFSIDSQEKIRKYFTNFSDFNILESPWKSPKFEKFGWIKVYFKKILLTQIWNVKIFKSDPSFKDCPGQEYPFYFYLNWEIHPGLYINYKQACLYCAIVS